MGKWIKRDIDIPKVPPHAHDYPIYNDKGDIAKGDIWRCSCAIYFQVSGFRTRTQDGEIIEWRAMWPEETRNFR